MLLLEQPTNCDSSHREGDIQTLKALSETVNAYTITITDQAVEADDLIVVNNKQLFPSMRR